MIFKSNDEMTIAEYRRLTHPLLMELTSLLSFLSQVFRIAPKILIGMEDTNLKAEKLNWRTDTLDVREPFKVTHTLLMRCASSFAESTNAYMNYDFEEAVRIKGEGLYYMDLWTAAMKLAEEGTPLHQKDGRLRL